MYAGKKAFHYAMSVHVLLKAIYKSNMHLTTSISSPTVEKTEKAKCGDKNFSI